VFQIVFSSMITSFWCQGQISASSVPKDEGRCSNIMLENL